MDASNRRVVLLGKTGAGKSSTADTIFGEPLFRDSHTSKCGTKECRAGTRSVNGRSITLIDTPGFFDTNMSEEDLKPAIIQCITECAPGPHAFLILLKVERYTEHDQAVITQIKESFSEEVFRYATVVFTHGDQLNEGHTIKDFVREEKNVGELVKKCSGRCHVIDNKYWKEKPMNEYRSNKFQVEQLLKTIDEMIEDNNDGYYTNEMLQAVEEKIQRQMEVIEQPLGSMSKEEIRRKAKDSVWTELLTAFKDVTVHVLLGAYFGVATMVEMAVKMISTMVTLVTDAVQAVVGAVMRWFN